MDSGIFFAKKRIKQTKKVVFCQIKPNFVDGGKGFCPTTPTNEQKLTKL